MKSATVLEVLRGELLVSSRAKKVTTHILQEMKRSSEKIAMLTAYDYTLARLVAVSYTHLTLPTKRIV